jgi:hypothetical protein
MKEDALEKSPLADTATSTSTSSTSTSTSTKEAPKTIPFFCSSLQKNIGSR